MRRTFLKEFRDLLPNQCPVAFHPVRDGWDDVANVVIDDADVYIAIGKVISMMPRNLQDWYDEHCAGPDTEIDEKLCNIFCREYDLEF